MPGFLVGRDVSRVERPERREEGESSGIFGAIWRGVTDHAIGGAREIFAAFDDIRVGKIGRNAGWIGGVIIGEGDGRSSGERYRPWTEYFPSQNRQSNDDHERNSENCAAPAHDCYALPVASALRSIGRRRNATPVAA